jgi:hypothetical protein
VKIISNENIPMCFKASIKLCAFVKIVPHSILTQTAKISGRVGLYEESGIDPQEIIVSNDGRLDVKKDGTASSLLCGLWFLVSWHFVS